MTDAPYDKAIEESAKATGKALDLVKDSAQPIANMYGLLIGDQIGAARDRRLDAITRKTKKILRERDLAETAEIAEQIAIPLLEAAQGEPREEMQDLWARLLANAMDPARCDDVRPEYIATLRSFHPSDALVLKAMDTTNTHSIEELVGLTGLRESSVVVSVANLKSARCIRSYNDGAYFDIASFGSELLRACSP